MRTLRYSVAASLDGYIADARGGFDWIPNDSTVDFAALFARVDTILLGRRTYDTVRSQGGPPWPAGARVYVISRALAPGERADMTVVRDDPVALAEQLRHEEGSGEIWLFGGGQLFAALLAGRQVDRVEVTVVPVLLGDGVPLVAAGIERTALTLVDTKVYPSGMVALNYSVQ
ncbi:MAG: dihydrofolate reductase family protein [Gemmatimonadaceae bacterium]